MAALPFASHIQRRRAWLGSFDDDAIALSNRKLVKEELAIAKRKVTKLEAVLAGTYKPGEKARPSPSKPGLGQWLN